MFRLKNLNLICSMQELQALPQGKLLINTINAHSYNTARKDTPFAEALEGGDALIPDGMSIVKACKWIGAKSQPTCRIAGWDLFCYEMGRTKGTVMFLGSSEQTLQKIKDKAKEQYHTLTSSPIPHPTSQCSRPRTAPRWSRPSTMPTPTCCG